MANDFENKQANAHAKFRYYCHGCTKPAAYSNVPFEGREITCPHCGKVQVAELKNWLPNTQ